MRLWRPVTFKLPHSECQHVSRWQPRPSASACSSVVRGVSQTSTQILALIRPHIQGWSSATVRVWMTPWSQVAALASQSYMVLVAAWPSNIIMASGVSLGYRTLNGPQLWEESSQSPSTIGGIFFWHQHAHRCCPRLEVSTRCSKLIGATNIYRDPQCCGRAMAHDMVLVNSPCRDITMNLSSNWVAKWATTYCTRSLDLPLSPELDLFCLLLSPVTLPILTIVVPSSMAPEVTGCCWLIFFFYPTKQKACCWPVVNLKGSWASNFIFFKFCKICTFGALII